MTPPGAEMDHTPLAAGPTSRPARRAVALIDGEHYPEVVLAALRYVEQELELELTGLVFLGGTEKVRDPRGIEYRDLPVYHGGDQVTVLRRALLELRPSLVIDLSDEPVVGYAERFRLISEALARGAGYHGADFTFEAPEMPYLCDKPSIGVWGTGKRVGKTALAGHAARNIARGGSRPCVCTMGRGGPPEPELLAAPAQVTDDYLRARVEAGCHAASDHFEDAMMGGIVTVGCRRCGGGMAGAPFFSNVGPGALLACRQDADIVLFEGSGAAVPPVGVDAVMLVTSALQAPECLLGYLGPYRLLRSDLVVVTMCEEFLVSSDKLRKLMDGIGSINPEVKVVKTVFRPRPLGELREREVFLASTAPPEAARRQAAHLEEEYKAVVVGTSSNLADRRRLEADLEAARGARVMVTELKAAGVDVVSLFAARNDKEIVYLENRPVAVGGDLEEEIDRLEATARARSADR